MTYVYNTVPEDTSILKPSTLIRLMSMQKELGAVIVDEESEGEAEAHSLALRSNVDSRLWYEIVRIIDKPHQDQVLIYVCVADTEDETPNRAFCCYVNGDILTWGLWFAEMLHTLPLIYEQCSQIYADKLISHYADRGLIANLNPTKPNMQRYAETMFKNSDFFSPEAMNTHAKNKKLRVV